MSDSKIVFKLLLSNEIYSVHNNNNNDKCLLILIICKCIDIET